MLGTADIFCFSIGEGQFAVPLDTIDRVIHAVALTHVPNLPESVLGVFDYHGQVVPAINLRHRLNLPAQSIRTGDVFIMAQTKSRKIAIVADSAHGILHSIDGDFTTAAALGPEFEADGLLRRDDGIIVIYDVEKFLSAQDETDLQQILDKF